MTTNLYLTTEGVEYALAEWLALRGDLRHAVVLDMAITTEISMGPTQFGALITQ
jgi:hypothetical protein